MITCASPTWAVDSPNYIRVLLCTVQQKVALYTGVLKVRSVPEQWSIWPKHDKSIF